MLLFVRTTRSAYYIFGGDEGNRTPVLKA